MVVTAPASTRPDIRSIVDLVPDNAQWVGGQWLPAISGETIDVIDPSSQEVIRRIPRGRAEDIDRAVRAAAAAFPAWRDTNPQVRAALLRSWADLCTQHGEEIDTLEAL